MPFRTTFDCLWCGSAWSVRGPDDLEGWAQLCPTCVGKAGDNGFLRFRLRNALAERGVAKAPEPPGPARDPPVDAEIDAEMRAYYAARAGEYDDWYLRRGRYSHGPVHDAAWNAELDAAGRWLDQLPLHGSIVELAAGTGWWSPLLAGKGELSLYDAAEATLDRARERLVAHRLRAHLHVRDAWAEPDRQVDGLFAGFWLSHVPRSRLDAFLALARRWLKPGGTFAFIDSLPDPQSGAVDNPLPSGDIAVRRLADGREFRVVKAFHPPTELRAGLLRSGFADAEVTTTGRFFLLGRATA
ncbi:MAG TPA: class I SAM-dependent methyltransferase [Candidatus Limnocylindrales bacterium]|jgi:demethylmenaquinone methyltransferase/2-methoxy-6-polyprenyl-1,4-benzoquinol methylase|nr:class I SAM-dependent methyltransferase [Candidatus Limnocylindrales bacterium]